MTTHEMILLCSSLPGVGRCIPLCLVLGFCSFWKNLGTPYLGQHAAVQQIFLGDRWCLSTTISADPTTRIEF